MLSREDIYSSNIFLNAALPLLKVIVQDREDLKDKFKDKNAIVQICANDTDVKIGTYYVIENGEWNVKKGIADKADLTLEFKDIRHLNEFFSGKSKKLPKVKGIKNVGLLIGTFKLLMTLGKILGSKDVPQNENEKDLMVKMYFYLLSLGISALNKCEHPEVSKWAKKSPDRVYAWVVTGKPELSAYIRVKAGNTKAARGEYRRAKPFFTMRFNSSDSALGILLEKDNLIKATVDGRLTMEGAPEFGAQIGELMGLVGMYAK